MIVVVVGGGLVYVGLEGFVECDFDDFGFKYDLVVGDGLNCFEIVFDGVDFVWEGFD